MCLLYVYIFVCVCVTEKMVANTYINMPTSEINLINICRIVQLRGTNKMCRGSEVCDLQSYTIFIYAQCVRDRVCETWEA